MGILHVQQVPGSLMTYENIINAMTVEKSYKNCFNRKYVGLFFFSISNEVNIFKDLINFSKFIIQELPIFGSINIEFDFVMIDVCNLLRIVAALIDYTSMKIRNENFSIQVQEKIS